MASVSVDLIPSPSPDDVVLLLGLEVWEVGLVAANITVVLLILLCLLTVILCLRRQRRYHSNHDDEEFLLKRRGEVNEEEEDVDHSSPVEVPFNSISFQDLLHRGTFKTVHRAIVNYSPRGMTGLEVAIKQLKDIDSDLGQKELMAETYLLRSLLDKAGTHPNVVSLVGTAVNRGSHYLLLEYVSHGTLDRFLWSLKKGPVPEWYLRYVRDMMVIQEAAPYNRHVAADLMRIAVQVADGMCFLANHGFVHHDLSTRNVMIGPQLQVRISNPGMFHEGYYYTVTAREHFLHDMAPECLWEKRFSLFSDVWSFGIMLYKVVTLETNPYPGIPPKDLYDHIVMARGRPRLLSSFSNELYFLLQRCWQVVPTDRPNFPVIFSELKSLSSSPNPHIILKTSKDEYTPGYVSENGQVFLHFIHPCVFNPALYPSSRRYSNPVSSSADDTIYSREAAESLLYLCSSELESTYTTHASEDDEDTRGQSTSEPDLEREEEEDGEADTSERDKNTINNFETKNK